jgi:glycosyltransferase involved in cell wall biosynthesis
MSLPRLILAKYAATRAKKIIVDAEGLKKIWTHIGIPQNKVEVIPFGVDTSLFNRNKHGNDVRKKLNIRKSDIIIISTRPFFEHYNIDCLIKAVPKIVKKYDDVKFVIKGKGPLDASLKKLACDLGVDQHIKFSDPVPYSEMAHYLTAADIYVSTSFIDSTSVSLLEAMACGLPPITTNISGNREWIKNQVNGLLYPPKDHEALAEKITQLIEHEDMRKQFGERSHQIIMEKATWKECVSKMETVYQSLT